MTCPPIQQEAGCCGGRTGAPTVHVRSATSADADVIARLVSQLGYPVSADDMPARLERIANDRRAVVLLAERDDVVVGLATAHILSVLNRSRDVAWLTSLVVDEHQRGTGAGRVLVEAVEQFARQEGCERLSVTTHEHMTGAQAFYVHLEPVMYLRLY